VRHSSPADDHALLPGAYLNASLIPPLQDAQANSGSFIVSQAPLPSTFATFFEQLYRHRVRTLVNLTPLVEGGFQKSDMYWPESDEPFPVAEGWTVRLTASSNEEAATVRQLRIAPTNGDVHELAQIHFEGWRDHGNLPIPEMLSLIKAVDKSQALAGTTGTPPPVWVHCSAGIGRSGTLVGALLARQLNLQRDETPGLAVAGQVTQHMRHYRPGMVQTPGQLLTLGHVVEALRALVR